MLNNILTLWEIPFLMFLICVYLHYQWNLFGECQVLYKAAAGWEARKSTTAAAMGPCFFENLLQNAGQHNLYFIGGCLLLGGAGSLVWMVLWAPVCIFLRFAQTLVLWEEGPESVGTTSCFTHIIRGQMHFASAYYLGQLYRFLLGAVGICGLHCWGVADWALPFEELSPSVTGNSLALLPFLPVFVVLAAPAILLGFLDKEKRRRFMKLCLIAYVAALLLLILLHFRLILPAMEVAAGDSIQLHNSISRIAGKGQFLTAAVGALLACCLSGLPWDEGIRRYVKAGHNAGVSPVTAGLWAMKQASAQLFLFGVCAGFFLLMIDLSSISSAPDAMHSIAEGNGSFLNMAGIFFLCSSSACLAWNRWLSCVRSPRTAVLAAAACIPATLSLASGDNPLWIKLLLSLLFLPLLFNLLLLLCLSERFRKIMDLCKKEIEVRPH